MQKTQQSPPEATMIKEATSGLMFSEVGRELDLVNSQPLLARRVLRLPFIGRQVLVVYAVGKPSIGSHS